MQTERLKILLELLENEPQDPFNRYAVAMEYVQTMPKEACKHLEILQKDFPDYLPTYYQAAVLFAEQEDIEQATYYFKEGIRLAEEKGNEKTVKELRAAFQMYQSEWEM